MMDMTHTGSTNRASKMGLRESMPSEKVSVRAEVRRMQCQWNAQSELWAKIAALAKSLHSQTAPFGFQ